MKMIWWLPRNLVNQFHGNFGYKSLGCRRIKYVSRDVKWCFNASWRLKGLIHHWVNVCYLPGSAVHHNLLLSFPDAQNAWCYLQLTDICEVYTYLRNQYIMMYVILNHAKHYRDYCLHSVCACLSGDAVPDYRDMPACKILTLIKGWNIFYLSQ